MSHFSSIGFSEAKRLLTEHIPSWADMVCDFVIGEQFNDGEYWIGPTLDESISESTDVLNNIEKGFIYSNKVAEVIHRHLDALITEDPDFDFVPVQDFPDGEVPDDIVELLQLANRLRDEFFERNHLDTVIEQAGQTLLWASRSALRIYVPEGQLDAFSVEGQRVAHDSPDVAFRMFPQEDIERAIMRLSMHHPSIYDAACLKDEETSRWICIYKYRETSNINENVTQPVSTRSSEAQNSDQGTERVEVSFIVRDDSDEEITVINVLDEANNTTSGISEVIEKLSGRQAQDNIDEQQGEDDEEARETLIALNPQANTISGSDVGFTFRMAGVLPVIEVFRERFITDAMIKQQMALNLAMTMVPRNITLAGFLERVITNGMPPGEYKTGTYDSQGNFTESANGKSIKFTPSPHVIGPATMNFYQGIKTVDNKGNVSLTSPGVHYKDPISPANIVDSKVAMYTAILEEARQLHVLTQGDGSISGISRVQARAEFMNSLSSTVRQLTRLLEWASIAPLKMAAALSGNPDMFNAIRPQVKIHVNLGPLTSEERESIIKQYDAGLLSRASALQMLGSRNVDVELQRLEEDPVASLEILQKQVEVATSMVEAGIELEVVAELVGLDAELVERMFDATNNVIEQ